MSKPPDFVADQNYTGPPWADGDALTPRGQVGEIVSRAPIDQHLDRIAVLMDRAIRIPGTNISFGLDPIIGFFFPVAGDAIGALVSAYIVIVSVRYGLPKGVIARMIFNIAGDFVLGSIPFLGDAAYVAWKVNTRNLRLLNQYASGRRGSFWSDWAWLFILLGALFLLIFGGLALIYAAIRGIGMGLV